MLQLFKTIFIVFGKHTRGNEPFWNSRRLYFTSLFWRCSRANRPAFLRVTQTYPTLCLLSSECKKTNRKLLV